MPLADSSDRALSSSPVRAAVLEILEGTLESRIIHVLLEMYPATTRDLERELKVKSTLLDRTLKAMRSRGIIEVEPLPDRTFVRLLRSDFRFVGRKESQRKRVKQHGGKREKPKEYDGPMFG